MLSAASTAVMWTCGARRASSMGIWAVPAPRSRILSVADGLVAGATSPQGCKQIGDEQRVDGGVVHRVVFARVIGGVHHFGFEDAWEHDF